MSISHSKRFEDKVVVITGGASGFGREMALKFAEEGAKVIIWDIDDEGGEETARMIKMRSGEAKFFHVDVRSSEQIKKAVEEIERIYGRVDILINNAGTHQFEVGAVDEVSEEEYDRVMNTNVKGVFLCSKYIIPLMRKNKKGVIINVASAWGVVASNKVPIYCASKAAVIQLTRAMALDYAKDGIRVIAISPGTCKTPLVERMIRSNYAKFGYSSPEEMWRAREVAHPLGLGTPEHIAKLVLFLASDDASWITGSNIIIDGGYTLGVIYRKT